MARFQAVQGDLSPGLEGALFGLLEGQKTTETPRYQGLGKLEEPESSESPGETEAGSQIPKDKDRWAGGKQPTRPSAAPTSAGPVMPRKFPAAEGLGSRAGRFSSEPLLSPPASVQPPPNLRPPRSLPSPAHLCSLRLLISLLFPPPSPSCLSPPLSSSFFSCLFCCVLSSLTAQFASLLLRAAGEEVSALRPGPARRRGRRFSYFSRVIWRDCMRARTRDFQAKSGKIQRQAERVRVFDVPRQLHKPPGTSVRVRARARAGCVWHAWWPGAPGPEGPPGSPGLP